jgi:aminopeptidase-like protein
MARSVYGAFEGYHNSLDTKEAMTIDALQRSLDEIERLLLANEAEGYYVNKYPFGEVKLDKHELYPDINSHSTRRRSTNEFADNRKQLNRIMHVLNYSDGEHTLADIGDLCGCSVESLLPIIEQLIDKRIIDGPYSEKREIF